MNNELKVCSPVESSGATETSASRPSAPKRSTAAERMHAAWGLRPHRKRRGSRIRRLAPMTAIEIALGAVILVLLAALIVLVFIGKWRA